jgi:hypothetical protein
VVGLIFSSCKKDGWPCQNGKGSVQTEIRGITGFTAIDDQMDANVFITQGAVYEVKVQAQENLLSAIRTEIEGNELQIWSEHCINKHEPINIYITLPSLSAARVSGSGYMITTNKITNPSVSLTVSGSGYFQAKDSIITTALDITISGSGKIDFIGEALSATAVIAGSGNITMLGEGSTYLTTMNSSLELTLSGSGSIQAFNYPVNNCYFTISGSGSAEVNVSTLLEGTLSGSGSLMYKGNPQVNVTTSGSGSVVHIN